MNTPSSHRAGLTVATFVGLLLALAGPPLVSPTYMGLTVLLSPLDMPRWSASRDWGQFCLSACSAGLHSSSPAAMRLKSRQLQSDGCSSTAMVA